MNWLIRIYSVVKTSLISGVGKVFISISGTLFLILLSTVYLQSQQISYIIPDIGAPGMYVYVEIVSQATAVNNFGSNGLYLNNINDDVRIELIRPEDTAKITFGPIIVSWSGRLISTHAFINKKIIPNSDNWRNLTTEFKIPFRVVVNGNNGNIDTFFIVQPKQLGDISGIADRVFGQGNLGIRSKRGAMIVDSLILANNTYAISTNDCDPYTNGNQGFLPFILLSKGNIHGSFATVISADGVGTERNAGPGGGGGGGKFCDGSLINQLTGDDGGDGFVGGGAGGRNCSGCSDVHKSAGVGTGSGGSSINGVLPPSNTWYEASGGGTGHPFGLSGESCGDGNNCNPQGQYGGGSGYRQSQPGGSGGYRTTGSNSSTINGGKIIGNIDGIPIAGGSGGASGNPNAVHVCSGNGGGGGGAVRIFARSIEGIYFQSNGRTGAGSSSGNGGHGSGGLISAIGKDFITGTNYSVKGGGSSPVMGGAGLAVVESINFTGGNIAPSSESIYRGICTDTTENPLKKFSLRCSKTSSFERVNFYIKPEGKPWRNSFTILNLLGITSFSLPFDLTGPDSVYYLVAVMDHGIENDNQYTPLLKYSTSQASANILYIPKYPIIAGDSTVDLNSLICEGKSIFDTSDIINTGDANLVLNFNQAFFTKGNLGFTLYSPASVITVPPGDTTMVIVQYSYIAGQKGIIRDTLILPHNDKYSDKKPWRIAYEVKLDSIGYAITDDSFRETDTLDLGKVCIDSISSGKFRIINQSENSIVLKQPVISNNTDFNISGSFTIPIPKNGNITGDADFVPKSKGKFISKIDFIAEDCDKIIKSLFLKGIAFDDSLSLEKPLFIPVKTINLGKICINTLKKDYFLINNVSGIDVSFDYSSQYKISEVLFSPSVNNFIPENSWDTLSFTVYPLTEGNHSIVNYIKNDKCSGYLDSVLILYEGVRSNLQLISPTNFGIVKIDSRDTIIVKYKNNGSGDVNITGINPITPPFILLSVTPNIPVVLKPGEEISFKFEFYPRTEGIFDENLEGIINIQTSSCPDSLKFKITGVGSKSEFAVSTTELDFGVVEYCQAREDSVLITNTSLVSLVLSNARISGGDDTYFTISQAPGSSIVASKQTVAYYIRFNPVWGPDGIKNSEFIVDTDDPNNKEIRIKLKGEQENNKVFATPNVLSFGTVPIGVQKTITLRLTNPGKIERNLIDVKSNNPDISSAPNAGKIFPLGGTFDVDIIWQPSTAGDFNFNVEFIFKTKCQDTLTITGSGTGQEGTVLITSKVDFALNAPCENVTDSISIINNGAAKVIIDSMKIIGTDASLFSFTDALAMPYQLDSGNTISRYLLFSPGNSSFGIKTAEIHSYVNVGNKTKEIITFLSASRIQFMTIDPNIIHFGNVVAGTSKNVSITVKNDGNRPVAISDFLPPNLSTIFIITPDPKGIIINPGTIINLNLEFRPQTSIFYSDSAKLVFDYTVCSDSGLILFDGNGVPPRNTQFWLPDTLLNPRWTNVHIPLYGKLLSANDSVGGISLNVGLTWDKSIFYPFGLTKGNITQNITNQNARILEFTIDSLNLTSKASIVTEIIGHALLGENDTTELNFIKLEWTQTEIFGTNDTIKGSIALEICREGQDRLVKQVNKPFSLSIEPNPGIDIIKIKMNLIENGKHTLVVSDIHGNEKIIDEFIINPVPEIEENTSTNDNHYREFQYNTDGLSTGVYFLSLRGMNRMLIERLYIIK